MVAGQVLPADGAYRRRIALSKPSRLSALVAFTVGFTTSFPVEWIGVLYVSELILMAIASAAVLTGMRQLWERYLLRVLFVLGLTFLGYAVSDLVIGTAPNEILRGWARTLFLGTNIVGLYVLCRNRPMNLRAFCVGFSVGTIVIHQLNGTIISEWKFGPAFGVALWIACLTPLLTGKIGVKLTAVLLAGFGVANIYLDFRSLSIACLLVSLLLFTRTFSPRTTTKSVILLFFFLSAALLFWSYLYTSTNEAFFGRRIASNAERTAGLFTAWNAISDSPWIGHGSWAVNSELQASFDALYREQSGHAHWSSGAAFTTHSELFQAWFEGGLLGMAFFVYFGIQLVRAFVYCVFQRPLDKSSPMFLLYLLTALWDVLFSPFAGGQRIHIAVACITVLAVKVLAVKHEIGLPLYGKVASDGRKRQLILHAGLRGLDAGS